MTDLRHEIGRRRLLGRGMSLGALTLLTGCDFTDGDAVQTALHAVSRWNDRVQAALFSDTTLAPTYDPKRAIKDFRFNAFFGPQDSPVLNPETYRLRLSGAIDDKRPWSVEQLRALPQESQVTRHICVEGWSMIGQWAGQPLGQFLKRVGADTRARYVGFECADGYYGGIDMATALHPQTIMAMSLSGETLPTKYGFPLKVRIPTKLGFKNPKWVTAMCVTNQQPRGFWEDRGYNWFSGT